MTIHRNVYVNEAAPPAAAGAGAPKAADLTARQKFLNRSRFGGHDSAEEEQLAQVTTRNGLIGADGVPEPLPAEAALARMTRNPPGYGPQLPQPVAAPQSAASKVSQSPTTAESLARGISGPPYAKKKLGGRDLYLFRQTHEGRDPTPEEEARLVSEGYAQ